MADAEAVGAELRRERERGEALRRAVDEAEAATTARRGGACVVATLATEAEGAARASARAPRTRAPKGDGG